MAREFSKPFYNSKEWKKTREVILKRDNYICKHCGMPAEEVHHIKHITPRNVYDLNITMNPDNLISLCKDCHFKVHKEERAQSVARSNKRRAHKRIINNDGTYFDDEGMLVKRKVYIVYGSPRAGKTTYVIRHKDEHDVAIDVDAIISALQLSDKRYTDNNLKYLALDIRDYLFKELENNSRNFDCKHVWIIGGFPDRKEREELAHRLNADLIYIESTQKETEERAKKSDLYGDKQYAIDAVNAWWRKYQP